MGLYYGPIGNLYVTKLYLQGADYYPLEAMF